MRKPLHRVLSAASLLALAVAGCGPKPSMQTQGASNVARNDGLAVRIHVPSRELTVGQKLAVTVTATNTTDEPMTIYSPSGAPVLVRVVYPSLLGTELIKTYPGTATTNILTWTLPAGESRTFKLLVPVEPDWPVGKMLYLTAELNGYPGTAPSVYVQVHSPEETGSAR